MRPFFKVGGCFIFLKLICNGDKDGEIFRFASQQGMTGFGTIRNTTYEAEAGELPYEDMKKSETIIPSQAGWNRGDSQKVCTFLFLRSS